MDTLNSNEKIKQLIEQNRMVLVYFGGSNCNVCTSIKPKVEELLKNYSKIKSVQIEVEKSPEIAAAYSVFTIPVILLFIEGKEIIREARHISIQGINDKIRRYYNMIFE